MKANFIEKPYLKITSNSLYEEIKFVSSSNFYGKLYF